VATQKSSPDDRATVAEFRDVARELTGVLGGPNVAFIGGVRRTATVSEWIAGADPSNDEREQRLRLALRLVLILKPRFGQKTIRAWFLGANRALGLDAPIAVLATRPPTESAKALILAAEAALEL
jgi:hypothetical protein